MPLPDSWEIQHNPPQILNGFFFKLGSQYSQSVFLSSLRQTDYEEPTLQNTF